MMQKLRRWVLAFGVMAIGFSAITMMPASTAYAAPCKSNFLTFPAWYRGLLNGKCEIRQPDGDKSGGGISSFIWHIVLNVIEIALQIVGYVSAGYIIYGGFKYLTSSGSADKTAAARKTILNAVIGLVISLLSVVVIIIVVNRI